MTDKPVIRVGVGVIVMNAKGQFLIGKRRNAHGEGMWAIIGGHLEYGEDFIDCTQREVKEETGLDLVHIETLAVANHIFPSGKHYISIYTIGMIADPDAIPQMDEREFSDWIFYADWDALPQPLFVPYQADVKSELIADYKKRHGIAV